MRRGVPPAPGEVARRASRGGVGLQPDGRVGRIPLPDAARKLAAPQLTPVIVDDAVRSEGLRNLNRREAA